MTSFCPKRALSSSTVRLKYSSTTGVKGIKGRKFKIDNDANSDGSDSDNDEEFNLEEDK